MIPLPAHPSPSAVRRNFAGSAKTWAGRGLAGVLALAVALPGQAATALADQPLFSSSTVPGNLALPLSVEYPTAVSVAHPDNTYSSANRYLGYFDPDKCYLYQAYAPETATNKSHFYPAGAATTRTCVGANDVKWSGNFLNWATMQTIDPFRWALTGGYRVVDTASLTILEKAWASGQGGDGNFPNRTLTDPTLIAGATPFSGTFYVSRVQGLGERMTLRPPGETGSMLGNYYNNTNLSGDPVMTRFDLVDFDWGNTSPSPGVVNADNFSARWTATSPAPSTGNYRFRTVSDDGVRLYVNGNLVIDNWTIHSPTTDTSATIALNAGDPIAITLEYFESGIGATMRLQWLPPGASAYETYRPRADASNTGSSPPYADPQLFVRVRVCDPSAAAGGVETNCQPYAGGNYKPEGLMQQYAKKIRYSVLGYLNDGNLQRDGGVLRAQQKFIGPTYPVPGLPDATNSAAEWNASTGVFVTNPDNITSAMGVTIANSGVMNYLNKFGEVTRGNYKTYDPVGELYYAALRYYKNLPTVPEWSSYGSASTGTRTAWADGFPVINSGIVDPIQYSCQKNFILGIGDVNSHADKNVPGPTGSANEPSKPTLVTNDPTYTSSINAVTTTNQVGVLQGLGSSLGTTENYNGCCNNNSALMAGLAYDANIRDIRTDLTNLAGTRGQTVQTYWLDVLEFQTYKPNNQFYLAAKYGGFKPPASYVAGDPLQEAWWRTTTDTVGSGTAAQPRPDNYFVASRPDQVVDGLTKAFADIAAKSSAVVASSALPLPQVASGGGNISYSASWDGSNWTGELIANELTYAGTAQVPTLSPKWSLSEKLAAQLAEGAGPDGTAGWNTNRRVVTWNTATAAGVPLRIGSLATAQESALVPAYVTGVTASAYLNYLRGDRSLEGSKLRKRDKLLGDIVGAKPTVVGPPSLPLSNSSNPGYSSFKTAQASRPTVVYVGSNDGLLHAVQGNLNGSFAGRELFAYMPGALFQGPTGAPATDGLVTLGNPAFVHHAFVDAAPGVYDMDMGKTAGSSTGTQWKSVLIGGLGKGSKAYYAIDVTDPVGMIAGANIGAAETSVASKVMWEFKDSRLGFTYGQPAVVKTRQHGWVVIVPSGYNNADGKGYFFILNARTGAVIQALTTGEGSTSNDAGLAQINAFVLDRTDGTADAAYAGDLLGNVWRVDLTTASGAYPAPTRLAALTDASNAVQPITSRPLIEVHPITKRRYVLLGTGKLLASGDIASTQSQSYYAIIDGTNARFNATAPTGFSFPIQRNKLAANTNPVVGVTVNTSTQIGWYLDLGNSWRVVGDSATFFGKITFASTQPSGDGCAAQGVSRVYSIDYDNGLSELENAAGTATGYLEFSSAVTDLQRLSSSGVSLISIGQSTGAVQSVKPGQPAKPPLRRLNWRELPIVN